MKILVVVLSVLLTPSLVLASGTIIGRPYDYSQAVLRTQGLRPVKVVYHPVALTCEDGFCEKYPEVYYCSGTGINSCHFVWRTQKGKYKIVDTHGEVNLIVDHFRDATSNEIKDFLSKKPYSY